MTKAQEVTLRWIAYNDGKRSVSETLTAQKRIISRLIKLGLVELKDDEYRIISTPQN